MFKNPQTHLVHDPRNSLREGDVVSILSGWRTARNKRHVVKHIIAPAHVPIDERPAVPTQAELEAEATASFFAKKARKEAVKEAAKEARREARGEYREEHEATALSREQ
jgi:small subunit ribosomal protein S17